jgi:aldose sugar dehydrogenase
MGARARIGLALVLAAAVPMAAAKQGGYAVEPVADRLEHPWSLAFLPDGRMLVTERPGRLRIIETDGRLRERPVEGVPQVHVGGQAGLKEIALAPDFEESRTVFLSYACGNVRENNTCLARARFEDDQLTDIRVIFTAQPLKRGNVHYGGRIVFLPDGTLVLTLGDGFDYREEAQNLGNHLGTIVRLSQDGSVPRDNPFLGQEGRRPEILSYGHRNVQGLVYDAGRKLLIAHEHGPRGGDEINFIEPGLNYGWPIATTGIDYTGARISPFQSWPGTAPPRYHWTPSIAPSGMAVVRGGLFPQWEGDLLIGALAREKGVHRMRIRPDGRIEREQLLLNELDERVRDVRVGPDGAIYVVTDHPENGRVLRLVPPTRK